MLRKIQQEFQVATLQELQLSQDVASNKLLHCYNSLRYIWIHLTCLDRAEQSLDLEPGMWPWIQGSWDRQTVQIAAVAGTKASRPQVVFGAVPFCPGAGRVSSFEDLRRVLDSIISWIKKTDSDVALVHGAFVDTARLDCCMSIYWDAPCINFEFNLNSLTEEEMKRSQRQRRHPEFLSMPSFHQPCGLKVAGILSKDGESVLEFRAFNKNSRK